VTAAPAVDRKVSAVVLVVAMLAGIFVRSLRPLLVLAMAGSLLPGGLALWTARDAEPRFVEERGGVPPTCLAAGTKPRSRPSTRDRYAANASGYPAISSRSSCRPRQWVGVGDDDCHPRHGLGWRKGGWTNG
jgi:hypothetical protein